MRCDRPRIDRSFLLWSPQQAVKLLFHGPVAFAHGGFQALSLEDGDPSAVIMDQTGVLKRAENFRDANPPDAQHMRQEFVRQRELGDLDPVMGHKNPPTTPLLDMMQAVTSHPLRDLP